MIPPIIVTRRTYHSPELVVPPAKKRATVVTPVYQNDSNPLVTNALCFQKIRRFDETGSVGIASGRERRPTESTIIEEVSNVIVAAIQMKQLQQFCKLLLSVVAFVLNIPWSTVRMILCKIPKFTLVSACGNKSKGFCRH